jgi:hypothetical protein
VCADFAAPPICCPPVPVSARAVPQNVERDGTSNDEWSSEFNTAADARLFPREQRIDFAIMRNARAHAHYVMDMTVSDYREIGRRDARARVRSAVADRLLSHQSDAGSLKTRVSAARLARVGLRPCVRLAAAHSAQPTRRGVERRDAWRIRTASD